MESIKSPIKPISIEDLPSDPNILPPKPGKLRGQLKTKRIRKGARDRRKKKYGNCKQTGHNTRRYRPACRKKERASDWVAIDNGDSGESEISQLTSSDFRGMEIESIGSGKGGGSNNSSIDMIISAD
jgi:hypothetical protein